MTDGTGPGRDTSDRHDGVKTADDGAHRRGRYPAAWRSVTPRAGLSDFPALIVYLSTSRLSGICVASARPGRTAETCAYPIRVLPPGGVLVRWNANALPNWRMPKATSTVAGRGAVESKALGGWCAVLGGTETITVMIPRAGPGKWYQIDACLRSPGLSRQDLDTVTASTSWSSDQLRPGCEGLAMSEP